MGVGVLEDPAWVDPLRRKERKVSRVGDSGAADRCIQTSGQKWILGVSGRKMLIWLSGDPGIRSWPSPASLARLGLVQLAWPSLGPTWPAWPGPGLAWPGLAEPELARPRIRIGVGILSTSQKTIAAETRTKMHKILFEFQA